MTASLASYPVIFARAFGGDFLTEDFSLLPNRDAMVKAFTVLRELFGLVRVVAEQADARDAEGDEHLRGAAVIARVLGLVHIHELAACGHQHRDDDEQPQLRVDDEPHGQRGEHHERDTSFTVIGVTALSTIAMIVYPLLSAALGFDAHQAGVFLGGTIHDVAQVVGAGYSVGKEAGDTATVVKLLRVAMLLPVILVLSLVFRAAHDKAGGTAKRPREAATRRRRRSIRSARPGAFAWRRPTLPTACCRRFWHGCEARRRRFRWTGWRSTPA